MTDAADLVFRRYAEIAEQAADLPAADPARAAEARARNAVLTKPDGALGRLEALAIWYAGWRAIRPDAPAQTLVFAANHGVAARGVSPYPSDVTAQMVLNFEAGGAAINQLCALAGARLEVIALDLERPTADFTQAPAMSEAECCAAVSAGWRAVDPDALCLTLGEMGIGNTTAAAALTAALMGGAASDWVGPGAGAEGEALERKRAAVSLGLDRHRPAIGAAGARAPLEALSRLGGREISALFGALLRARRERLPVLLDGYIVCAAAAALQALAADGLAHCQAGHRSAEPAHDALLRRLELSPLLDLGMRLGEGSGAALALSVLRAALACHAGMASFADAGVSTRGG